ncbi:MAG: tetratricopeptide repeat protein [Burkholderiales bacterium]|nr:tetratricopeptide repeat protein [Burkholderiales bacterium]
MDAAAQFDQAYAAHAAGDLQAAERGYRSLLTVHPAHFDALHMLGVAALQRGDAAGAADCIERALRVHPDVALAWQNLAAAYRGLGRPGDAADCLGRMMALSAETAPFLQAQADLSLAAGRHQAAHDIYARLLPAAPADPELLTGLGVACLRLRRHSDALQYLSQAVQSDAANLRAANNLGIAWQEMQRHDEALLAFDRLLQRAPDYAAAHNARALTLWRLGRIDEAERSYDQALECDPDYAEAWSNRGALHLHRGRIEQALQDYRRAIALRPAYAEAHNGMGAALAALNQIEPAIACYLDALKLSPDLAAAHNNLGVAQVGTGRMTGALSSFTRAVELRETDPATAADAYANRSDLWLRARRYPDAAADARAALAIDPGHPYTLGRALYAEMMQADWRLRAASVEALEGAIHAGRPAATPFLTLAVIDDPALQCTSACSYAARQVAAADGRLSHRPSARERISVAWVGSDFHEHATAHLMAGLLDCFDRSRFELLAYSYGPATGDRYQQRLQRAFDRYVDVRSLSDAETASAMRDEGVHIAIDLKGYTNQGRPGILGLRAAPVQLSYLGYPGTLGMHQIDYLIADAITLPPEHERHYTERIARLPCCYQCNDDRRTVSTRRYGRAELGLPEAGFVYCNFNSPYKITPQVFDVWMRLLSKTPRSVLWLLDDNADLAPHLRMEAAHRGLDPSRLVFAPRMPPDEHLARQVCADLFLDTWPVNAHTTASDALWVGLPLVTLECQAFAGRVASSLLHAIGAADCVTRSVADYESLALSLAIDPHRLAALRARFGSARTSSRLFDTRRYTRDFESLLTQIYERHIAGLTPASFTVQSIDC